MLRLISQPRVLQNFSHLSCGTVLYCDRLNRALFFNIMCESDFGNSPIKKYKKLSNFHLLYFLIGLLPENIII